MYTSVYSNCEAEKREKRETKEIITWISVCTEAFSLLEMRQDDTL